jgi:integrase
VISSRGEALALHWADVDLDARMLFVRYTPSNINNTAPVFTAPKSRSSHAWIGLSERVVRALRRQAERQRLQRIAASARYRDQDLVFTRADGQPLRPECVLRHLHQLSDAAGLPRIRVHDLRHFAATTSWSAQVPLAIASKTMRHSTLSTTTERWIATPVCAGERPPAPRHRRRPGARRTDLRRARSRRHVRGRVDHRPRERALTVPCSRFTVIREEGKPHGPGYFR